MVDTTLPLTGRADAVAKGNTGAVTVRVLTDMPAAMAAIDAITPDMVFTGYQHPDFLRAWLGMVGCKPMFMMFRAPGHGEVVLPLELCGNHVAGYCGARHANGNFPVGRRADIEALNAVGESALREAILKAGSPAATLALERQYRHWDGLANPFVFTDSIASPNPALSFVLDPDFNAVLAPRSAKRKRKKSRSNTRKLEVNGEVRFHHPVAPDDVPAYLNRFFALKADRFREVGIRDVFSDARTKAFFHALFEAENSIHELHALTVDDQVAAVIGCTIHDGRLVVEFGSFDPQFGHAGPGDLLFFNTIRHACERGYDVFDFGVGDEPYKRAWCDIETTQMDTSIGLTWMGRTMALAHTVRSHIVRAVKSNERVWTFVKAVRKRLPLR